MRTIFSVAALSASAFALNQFNGAIAPNTGSSHSHSQDVAHVDPWMQCKVDIEQLEGDVDTLTIANGKDNISQANLEAQTDGLYDIIKALAATNLTNEGSVTGLSATEANQQTKIDTLVTDAAGEIVIIQNNLGSLEIMQMVINALPTEADFGARVNSLNTRVQALSAARTIVQNEITTATNDYNTKNTEVATASQAKTDLDTAILNIESSVALNE